jgi:UDP-N-acetylglucosamine:LPS N-acetylglucosamine transferase
MQRPVKICLVASAGGHLSQLLKLEDSWNGHNTLYVTTSDTVREKLQKNGKVYVVGECNRQHPLKVALVSIRCIRIILKERPGIVISTGAAVGCIMCFLGGIIGAKIIWIDSITNVIKLSLSGRLVRRIADLFLTQWPQFAEQYENVEYVGAII